MIKKIKNMKFLYEFLLIMVSFLWGMGFIWTKQGMDLGLSPFMFIFLRYTIASLIMLPFCIKELKKITKNDLIYGGIGGVILYISMMAQTTALSDVVPSVAAFLTTTYVVMVPFVSWIISHKKPKLKIYVCAALTLVGMYILTVEPGVAFKFVPATYMLMFTALMFAVHVVYTGIVSKLMNAKLIVIIPFICVSIFSSIQGVVSGGINFDVPQLWLALFYVFMAAAFAAIIAGFLQVAAQKHVESSRAAIIFALESVFTAILSIIYGLETLNLQLLIGGSIIVVAIILSELNEKTS